MGAVLDGLSGLRRSDHHAMDSFAVAQVKNVEANVLTEAHVGFAIASIHGERKHTPLADTFKTVHQRIVPGAVNPEIRLRAEIDELSIQARDAVVSLRPGGQPFDYLAIRRIEDEEPAVRAAPPPTGGRVELSAIRRDARTINSSL